MNRLVVLLLLPVFLYSQDVPSVEFTIRDVLNVIGEYDVQHVDVPVATVKVWGQTDFNARKIYIYRSDVALMRSTLTHEILHVLYHQRGLYPNEERILQEEQRIMLDLYGLPGMNTPHLVEPINPHGTTIQ